MRKKLIWLLIAIVCVTVFIGLTVIVNNCFFSQKEPLVYVTKYGECYHSAGCHYLDSIIEKGLYEAQKEGYRACSYCHGIPNGTIEKNNYPLAVLCVFCGMLIVGLMCLLIYFCKKKTFNCTNV